MAKVTAIPAKKPKLITPEGKVRKLRVAGYARVSTDDEEQLNSYDAQLDYYENKIKSNPDWEFVKVYTDEGITATNNKKRDGFKEMVKDALDGKIDRILTKSISRFARNTVVSLTTIRQLKEKGIGIYFEKENIDTLDAKGELLITIMSSLAQEESRSISENVLWGTRKKMADGKFTLAYSHFLGYDKGEDGKLVINEEQAKIIKLIYRLFLSGKTPYAICSELEKRGILTPYGKDKWSSSTVKSILTNEKYKGDALLQKYYTVDFLDKKLVRNDGTVPQYYVTGCHEPIIDPETFDLVQAEILKRSKRKARYSGSGIFSTKVICGDCGEFYGSKVWHSNDKYRKRIYQCNAKFKDEHKCRTPHLTEEELKTVFCMAMNDIFDIKDELIENISLIITTLDNSAMFESKRDEVNNEIEMVVQMMESLIRENSTKALDQTAYSKKYDELARQYEDASLRLEDIEIRLAEARTRKDMLEKFIAGLRSGYAGEFDEDLFYTMVDTMTVHSKENIVVLLKCGTEITVRL